MNAVRLSADKNGPGYLRHGTCERENYLWGLRSCELIDACLASSTVPSRKNTMKVHEQDAIKVRHCIVKLRVKLRKDKNPIVSLTGYLIYAYKLIFRRRLVLEVGRTIQPR